MKRALWVSVVKCRQVSIPLTRISADPAAISRQPWTEIRALGPMKALLNFRHKESPDALAAASVARRRDTLNHCSSVLFFLEMRQSRGGELLMVLGVITGIF